MLKSPELTLQRKHVKEVLKLLALKSEITNRDEKTRLSGNKVSFDA